MKLASFAILCLVTISPLPVMAQESVKQFAVEGAGRLSCSDFLRARSDKTSGEYQRIIGFTEGYLTGANRYEQGTFDLTPWHNAAAFDLILESHCSQNADDTLASVVQRMVTGFRPIRVAQFSQLLEVGDGQNRTYVYEAILRRAQAALQVRGLYSGPEDGRFTAELRKAFLDFQGKSDLSPTGVPDPATLWMLLNP